MQQITKQSIKDAISVIRQEKKNLQQIRNEVEKTGLITLENKKGIRNINKLHDVRFKNSIIRLKNNIGFIKDFKNHNMFIPLFNQIIPPINKGVSKKNQIKKQIEEKMYSGFNNNSFLTSAFKDDIKEKIEREIQNKVIQLKEKLEDLSLLVYQQFDPENEEDMKMIKKIEEEGIQPLTQTGKLWDFLIATTPDKNLLVKYLDILLNFSIEEILNLDKRIEPHADESFFNKVKTFKNYKNINTLQPLRTSLLLFNQYISQLEREIIFEKYYKEENFNQYYLEFLKNLQEVKEIFDLNIELTKAQKLITFSYIEDVMTHIKGNKKLQPITLLNTSEVGSGKTFTIPFVAYLISSKYLESYNKKSVFLIITEANLLLETKQKLVDEVGLDEEHIEILKDNSLENHKILPWKIYLISKNRLQMISPVSARNFAKKCKKHNLLINLILDEASYLKNSLSKTSQAYHKLKSKLIKEKSLGFEMLMTATPISNDSSDIVYFVNPNKKIVQNLQENFLNEQTKFENFRKSYRTLFKEETLSFKEVLKIASYGYNKYLKVEKNIQIEPKAGALLSVYHNKYFNYNEYLLTKNMYKNKKSLPHSDSPSDPPSESSAVQHTTGIMGQRKGEKNFRRGVKDKKITTRLLDCLTDLSDMKGIDRILNSEDVNNSVITNSVILETNFIEACAFNEMIKNSRIIANFQKFKDLVETLKQFNVENEDIENEKFLIRNFILTQVLNDLEVLNITQKVMKKEIPQKNDTKKKIKINQILVNKINYIHSLEEILQQDPKSLFENFMMEINPISYFRIKEIKNQLKENMSNQKRKELENTLSKIESEISQEFYILFKQETKNLINDFISQIKKDLKLLKNIPNTELIIAPLSLSSYTSFINSIEDDLKTEPALQPVFENPSLSKKILEDKEPMLNIYSTISQASESLNMPIISKHLKRTARALKNLLEEHIEINEYNFEKITEFIARNASTTINTMKKIKEFCNQNNTPALITTNYKNSTYLLQDKKDLVITGNLTLEKRKEIIDKMNTLENKDSLIATASSILKGISFYYIPYGVLPESPKNAEFRTQIAGRLRTLFNHQIKMIKESKNRLKEKSKCLNILEMNHKYFDIISSEIMLSFPNIQQEKNILIEKVKYISQHQKIVKIDPIETISQQDLKYGYRFNKDIIEEHSNQIKQEKLENFLTYIKETNENQLNTDKLIKLLSNYLNQIAEKNLKRTTIFKILS